MTTVVVSERSEQPCGTCGECHILNEFEPGSKVVVVMKRRWTSKRVSIGDVGVVREWSQMYSPVYYRVQFENGERENFDPCELRSIN